MPPQRLAGGVMQGAVQPAAKNTAAAPAAAAQAPGRCPAHTTRMHTSLAHALENNSGGVVNTNATQPSGASRRPLARAASHRQGPHAPRLAPPPLCPPQQPIPPP